LRNFVNRQTDRQTDTQVKTEDTTSLAAVRKESINVSTTKEQVDCNVTCYG